MPRARIKRTELKTTLKTIAMMHPPGIVTHHLGLMRQCIIQHRSTNERELTLLVGAF